MDISVVIPLYNESRLISRLLKEIVTNLSKTEDSFEIVCVDDGSTDSTLEKLLSFKKENNELKVISLSRNFGLQAAINAGLDRADDVVGGDAVRLVADPDRGAPAQDVLLVLHLVGVPRHAAAGAHGEAPHGEVGGAVLGADQDLGRGRRSAATG